MSSFVGAGGGGTGSSNRTELTQNTTYYVATTGSDVTGTGTIGNPWATPQKAMDFITEFVDTGGYDIIVQIEDGTYNLGPGNILQIRHRVGGGDLTFQGNTGDKTKVILQTTTAPNGAIATIDSDLNSVNDIGLVVIQFFQIVQNEGNDNPAVFNCAAGGQLIINNIDYAGGTGLIRGSANSYTEVIGHIGILTVGKQLTDGTHILADLDSFVYYNVDSVTTSVPVSFRFGFANAQTSSSIQIFIASSFGTFTGLPYFCFYHGTIILQDGDLTMIPGTLPGIISDPTSAIIFASASNYKPAATLFNQIGSFVTDNGTTVTFDIGSGEDKSYTVTGNRTFAFTNWPSTAAPIQLRGQINLQLINGGAFTLTWPSNINWITGDGDTSTSFSDLGVPLHIAGSNFIELWSDDGGVTIYGLLLGSATFNFSSGQVPAAPSFPGIPHQIAWDVSGNMYICYQANTWAKYTNVFTPPPPSTDAQPLGMP